MLDSSEFDIAGEQATKVHVSTIQRLYSILRGEPIDQDLDEKTGFETSPERPVEVAYNPRLPIESYDCIIVDECHRSIYGVWRQVLEYFDAFLIGLTATPGKQTFGFFNQNLVMEYGHEQAVADRVNVDFDVFRIRTEVSEVGGKVPAGFVTEFRDRETRRRRFEMIDQELRLPRLPARPQGGDPRSNPYRGPHAARFDARDVPRPGGARGRPAPPRPQDADLRQDRQPRRRHSPDRPGGARPRQPRGGEDHLQVRCERTQARGAVAAVPDRLPDPHRG